MSSLRTHIQASVSRTYLFYTFGTTTAREMLMELQKRLQPTDQLRELDLSNKYQKLKKAPKSQDLDNWLHTWEKVYHECTKINLPDVQNGRAVRDFLRAVSTITPEFSIYWINDILKMQETGQNPPDLFRMVEYYRNHRRHLITEKIQANQSAFSTTFQGQPQESTCKKECLCGELH